MKDCNEWNSFVNSGKVQDYLSYREGSKSISESGRSQKLSGLESKIQLGASPYAGFFGNNGIDTTSGSNRGL